MDKHKRKQVRNIPFRMIIPNMITSGSVFCGVSSIILTSHGKLLPAAALICFAVFFDVMDGRVARSLGGGSHFGEELDSLADAISFGVAPLLRLHRPGYRDMGAARRFVLRALRRSAPRALQRYARPRGAVPGASDSSGRTDARRYGHSWRSRDAARRDMRDVLHRRADGQLRALLQREAPQRTTSTRSSSTA